MADENRDDLTDETSEAAEAEAPVAAAEELSGTEPVSDAGEAADEAPEADVPEPELAAAEASAADEEEAPETDVPEPESDAGEAAGEAPEAATTSKKKRKRLPRSERRQRTRPKREKPAQRKPITRLPKPEHPRGRRQERQGTVVSSAADKTIVVRVDVVKLHPTYKKVIRRSTKLHAHDEQNAAKVGDVVRIVETRPLSRMKRWRLQEIVEEAK